MNGQIDSLTTCAEDDVLDGKELEDQIVFSLSK